MTQYKSIATEEIWELDGEGNFGSESGYCLFLKKNHNSFSERQIAITPSDLALGFTKVEEIATPSDSLVGKKFMDEFEDVTVLFADDVWVVYISLSATTPIVRTKEMFFATFTEITGE